MKKKFTFDFIEKNIRKATFGILSTVSDKGWPQSSGIIYGVSPPSSKLYLTMMTEEPFKKVQNIKANNKVTFVIPFPHHIFRFAPSSVVSFQGTAEIHSITDEESLEIFKEKRILRMNLKVLDTHEDIKDPVFIKVKPISKMQVYGLGIGLIELSKDHAAAGYSVEIPPERL